MRERVERGIGELVIIGDKVDTATTDNSENTKKKQGPVTFFCSFKSTDVFLPIFFFFSFFSFFFAVSLLFLLLLFFIFLVSQSIQTKKNKKKKVFSPVKRERRKK